LFDQSLFGHSGYFDMSLISNSSQIAGNITNDLEALDGFGIRGSLIGAFISAVLYGIAVLISVACLRLLARSKQIYHSKRRFVALCLHNGFMLACGTEALVSECWLTVKAIERKLSLEILRAAAIAGATVPGVVSTSSSATVNLSPIALPLTVWGADGFLVRFSCLMYLRAIMMTGHTQTYAVLTRFGDV
jgi:hypothetical protein